MNKNGFRPENIDASLDKYAENELEELPDEIPEPEPETYMRATTVTKRSTNPFNVIWHLFIHLLLNILCTCAYVFISCQASHPD